MGPLSVMNKYVVITLSTSLSHSPCDQLQLNEGSLGLQASEILNLSLLQKPPHPPWTSLCPGASPGRWEEESWGIPAIPPARRHPRGQGRCVLQSFPNTIMGVEGGRIPATASQGRKKEILVGSRGEIRGVFSRVQTS